MEGQLELAGMYKDRARATVGKLVKRGQIVKADTCQICNNKYNKSGKLYGHHHWGYTGRYKTKVVWLCGSCHWLCHKQNH